MGRLSWKLPIPEVIEKLVTVTANFASLQEQVIRMEQRVNDHAERLARLEQREEL